MNSHLPASQPPIPHPPSRRRINDGSQFTPPMPHPQPNGPAVNMSMPMYPPYGHPNMPPYPMQHQMQPFHPQQYSPAQPAMGPPHQHPPPQYQYPPFAQYPQQYHPQYQGYPIQHYNPNAQSPMPMSMPQYPPQHMMMSPAYQPSQQRSPSPYYNPMHMPQQIPPHMAAPMPNTMMLRPEMPVETPEMEVPATKTEFNAQAEPVFVPQQAIHEPVPVPQPSSRKPASSEGSETLVETSEHRSVAEPESPRSAVSTAATSTSTARAPFFPPLPWYSPGAETLSQRSRRPRRRATPQQIREHLELPPRHKAADQSVDEPADSVPFVAVEEAGTPPTSHPPSEAGSTNPTTPSSVVAPQLQTQQQTSPAAAKQPIRPVIPILPGAQRKAASAQHSPAAPVTANQSSQAAESRTESGTAPETTSEANGATASDVHTEETQTTAEPAKSPESTAAEPVQAKPSSWAGLFQGAAQKKLAASSDASNGATTAQTAAASRADLLAAVLESWTVKLSGPNDIAFLEPRGLVNTGNMCYMNAVLQILIFNSLFYNFLDVVGRQTGHSFKGDTPLLDSMVMFMREYNVIDRAATPADLRKLLNSQQLEQYGEPLTPDYVYEVIRRLPRFASMRRGHQQDAEEFLGFLLEGLHEECAKTIESTSTKTTLPEPAQGDAADGWYEVGHKQKAAVTRSSGAVVTESPVTKVFGGILRSELRIPGLKPSVTYEPYQPLQLDIQAPHVRNITDALKGLTRSEAIHGEFNSPHGPGIAATKQMFIESLPPVLILHLKRFQYDNTGGTQKIWKKVGYPLELEIPREVLSSSKRTAKGGLPKYRLTGVIYHHGKSASGGHYTVDLLRQDGAEWIRLDDTLIRRVRREEVAEAGAEEEISHNNADNTREDGADGEDGWKQVNAGVTKSWSSVANGANTAAQKPKVPAAFVSKDRVAYLLFYSKI